MLLDILSVDTSIIKHNWSDVYSREYLILVGTHSFTLRNTDSAACQVTDHYHILVYFALCQNCVKVKFTSTIFMMHSLADLCMHILLLTAGVTVSQC